MKLMKYIRILIALITGPYFFNVKIAAQEIDANNKTKKSLYPIPILIWSKETKFGYGAALLYTTKKDSLSKSNSIGGMFLYTQRKQISIGVSTDHYWDDEIYHLITSAGYSKFPNYFYGIGANTPDSSEENFTPQTFSVLANFHKKIRPNFYVGGIMEMDYNKIIDVEDGRILDTANVPGRYKKWTSGLGAVVFWDSRNSNTFPTHGSFHQFSVVPFHRVIGSSYNFVRINLDLRQYFTFLGNHVLAYQIFGNFIPGRPPYHKMSMFGSMTYTRGYYPARYRDKHMAAFQTEYRSPMWWRFGLAAFGGYGDVAHSLGDFRVKRFKYSAGWGIRFALDKENRTNIRLDFAYGKNSSYPTIAFGEAF